MVVKNMTITIGILLMYGTTRTGFFAMAMYLDLEKVKQSLQQKKEKLRVQTA